MKQITDNMGSVGFERGKSSKHTSGWSYNVRWYDSSGAEIENITITGSGSIHDENYFWSAIDGSIDWRFWMNCSGSKTTGHNIRRRPLRPLGGEVFA